MVKIKNKVRLFKADLFLIEERAQKQESNHTIPSYLLPTTLSLEIFAINL